MNGLKRLFLLAELELLTFTKFEELASVEDDSFQKTY